ncbi:MAG TPA: hypothetical protein VF811_15450 [Parasulfuritortus sp.]
MKKTPSSLLLLPILFLGVSNVYAGTLQKTVSLPLSVDYDSNPRMTSSGSSVWRTSVSPKLKLDYVMDVDELSADLAVDEVRSSDTTLSANRTDPYVLLNWQHQMNKGNFSFSGKYDRASTRTTELQDTGYVLTDSTRTTKSLFTDGQYLISERTSLAGHLQYDRISYSSNSLTNYKTTSGSATLNYSWTERIQPFFSLYATRYDQDVSSATSSTQYMGQGGVKWLFSDTWDATVFVGAQRYSGNQTGSGAVGGVGIHHAGDRSDLGFKLNHMVAPSGLGGFVKADQATGYWSYSLSEQNRTGADLSWHKTQDFDRVTISQVGVWLSHEISQDWSTKLTYRHRTRDQSGSTTQSDMIGLSLAYQRSDF